MGFGTAGQPVARVVGLEKGRKTRGPHGRQCVGKDGAPEVTVEGVWD